MFPYENISEEIKTYIKSLFVYNDLLKQHLEISDYHLFHYRFGDDVFNQSNKNTFQEIIQYFDRDRNKAETCIVISDSFNFKKALADQSFENVCVHLRKPKHTNQSDGDDDINIFIDFFLIAKAKSVSCYSTYPWISNFVMWSSIIYDVPLIKLTI